MQKKISLHWAEYWKASLCLRKLAQIFQMTVLRAKRLLKAVLSNLYSTLPTYKLSFASIIHILLSGEKFVLPKATVILFLHISMAFCFFQYFLPIISDMFEKRNPVTGENCKEDLYSREMSYRAKRERSRELFFSSLYFYFITCTCMCQSCG